LFAIWYLGSEKGWPSFKALINTVWNGNFGVINICMPKKLWLIIMKLVLGFTWVFHHLICSFTVSWFHCPCQHHLYVNQLPQHLPRVNDSFVTWFSTQLTGNHNIDVACCSGLRTFYFEFNSILHILGKSVTDDTIYASGTLKHFVFWISFFVF
jgi:hypothetical protein